MKTILLTTVLILSSFAAKAQVFVTIDPIYLHAGILCNNHSIEKIGFYGRAQYGNIRINDFYTESFKIGSGISIPHNNAKFYVGLNYNHFFNTTESNHVDLNRISKLSFDMGVSLTTNRFTMLIMSDLVNWESIVGFSYRLKK
jgi:hypothetical protein